MYFHHLRAKLKANTIAKRLFLSTSMLLGGCASILSGLYQDVHVTTYCDSQRVEAGSDEL